MPVVSEPRTVIVDSASTSPCPDVEHDLGTQGGFPNRSCAGKKIRSMIR